MRKELDALENKFNEVNNTLLAVDDLSSIQFIDTVQGSRSCK